MVRLVPILVADVHTVYGTVASCIPDESSSLNVPDDCGYTSRFVRVILAQGAC